MKINSINFNNQNNVAFLKVAAYTRVSSDSPKAMQSLMAQIDYFQGLIKSRSDWQYVGIYSDFGISGTKADRPGFIEMIDEARMGNIDMIIAKSITRFARNLVVLLSVVREMRELGVDIYFEEENLHTLSETGEILITLLASKAEEEARHYSELAKMSMRSRFEKGIYNHVRLYGYKVVDGKYEIDEDEAKIIKRIFADYLAGSGITTIARKLNNDGILKDGNIFRYSTVQTILKNEKYTGSALLQKTYTPDFLSKRTVKNDGYVTQYYIEEDHPAIISVDDFNAVQVELARRKALIPPRKKYPVEPLFTGLLFCGNCGSPYAKRFHIKDDKYRISYNCMKSKNKATTLGKCRNPRIRESVLIQKTKEALGLPGDTELTKAFLKDKIIKIEVLEDKVLRFHLNKRSKDNGKPVVKKLSWDWSRSEFWEDDWKPLPNNYKETLNRRQDQKGGGNE